MATKRIEDTVIEDDEFEALGGFDIDDVILDGKDLEGDWNGHAYHVHIDPARLDYATYVRVQATDNELDPVVEMLSQVITEWDVRRGGKPVPVTPDGLKTVPVHLILNLFRRVWAEVLDTGNAQASSAT